MKHAKRTTIMAILAILILSTSLIAAEQEQKKPDQRRLGQPQRQMQGRPGMGPRGMRGGPGMGQMGQGSMRGGQMDIRQILLMLRGLKLTDEQKEQAKVIADKSKKSAGTVNKKVSEAMASLRDAVSKDASDEKIRECATAIGKAMGDQAIGQVKTIKDIKAILTEEQIEKFQDMRKRMQQRPSRRPSGREPMNTNFRKGEVRGKSRGENLRRPRGGNRQPKQNGDSN
jgi:Spy/CpxP family protein refolding chaperone